MVIESEMEELFEHCPTLYHMAERGSWPSIRQNGLLSTSALLDFYSVHGRDRDKIERAHRPTCLELTKKGYPGAIIRDQIPMSDSGLRRCLPAHMVPADWYEILNTKVFFWLSEDRLRKLTGARSYRDREHDVILVDARSLVKAYRGAIWLCAINSGCTKPFARARDESTFARIGNYPYSCWRKKRRRGERVVELAIDYAVPDIRKYVRKVLVMKGSNILEVIE